jgi:hypothetical protein
MEISVGIALLGLLVAVLSAVYTKRTADQARHANRIALYPARNEIFRAFREVGGTLTAHGVDIPKAAVLDFHTHVEASKSVFSSNPRLHEELEAFYRSLDELVELQRRSDPASVQKALRTLEDCEARKVRIQELLESVLPEVGDV